MFLLRKNPSNKLSFDFQGFKATKDVSQWLFQRPPSRIEVEHENMNIYPAEFFAHQICFVFMWAVIKRLMTSHYTGFIGILMMADYNSCKTGQYNCNQPEWNPPTYIIINPLGNIGCLSWLIISNYNPPYNPTNQDEMITDSRFSFKKAVIDGLAQLSVVAQTPCFCASFGGNLKKSTGNKWSGIPWFSWQPLGPLLKVKL